MDFEGYTFVFLSKYKQGFSLENVIYIMILLLNQDIFFNASYLFLLKLN